MRVTIKSAPGMAGGAFFCFGRCVDFEDVVVSGRVGFAARDGEENGRGVAALRQLRSLRLPPISLVCNAR